MLGNPFVDISSARFPFTSLLFGRPRLIILPAESLCGQIVASSRKLSSHVFARVSPCVCVCVCVCACVFRGPLVRA